MPAHRAGGHARMRRQRPPRDAAAADRRALGRLRRLDRPLDRRPPARGARSRRSPAADGVEVRFEGADHGAYHLQPVLAETDKDDLTFVRSLPLAHAADPAAEILIAYEMNGEPLGPDHGAPFRLIVPHWYAVASVKWLKRIDVLTEPFAGEFQTGHYIYEWPDRPHEPVTLMRVRARITDPAPGAIISRRHAHRPRQGLVGHRPGHQRRRQPHRRRRLARRRSSSRPRAPTSGRTGPSTGTRPTSAGTPCAPERPTPPATCSPTSRPGTGSATATTPSRSSTSTCADGPARLRGGITRRTANHVPTSQGGRPWCSQRTTRSWTSSGR